MDDTEDIEGGTDLDHLEQLSAELADVTEDWTVPVVPRSYVPGEAGQDDYEDEFVVFEMHGYGQAEIPGEDELHATFSLDAAGLSDEPTIIVRTYTGAQQGDAVAAFEGDAADLAADGYFPTSQSWAPGQWGGGAFLVALLLCVILIGLLVFIYMLIVKPHGTLTVTYSRSAMLPKSNEPGRLPQPHPTSHSAGLETLAMLEKLGLLRDSGVISAEEFEAKKSDLMSRI